jgi:hypothetical protein
MKIKGANEKEKGAFHNDFSPISPNLSYTNPNDIGYNPDPNFNLRHYGFDIENHDVFDSDWKVYNPPL